MQGSYFANPAVRNKTQTLSMAIYVLDISSNPRSFSLAIILLISWTQYPLFSQSILRVHILSFYQVIIIICSVHSHLYTQWNLSYLTENMHFPVFNLRHLIHFLISSRISLNYLNCIVYISGGGGSSFGIFFIEVELIYIMFQAYKKLNTS